MITLEDYIKDNIYRKYLYDNGLKLFNYNGFTPPWVLNEIALSPYYKQLIEDYNINNEIDIYNTDIDTFYNIINENLKSHNAYKLIYKINQLYQGFEFTKLKNKKDIFSFFISCNDLNKLKEFYNDYRIKNLLTFFNYKIQTPYRQLVDTYKKIQIEPTYPELITNKIFNESNGILYHICTLDNSKSILKNGLRCKQPKSQYRLYPERIYFLRLNNSNIYNKDNVDIFKQIFKLLKIKKICLIKVFKINLYHINNTGLNIDFYKDEFMAGIENNCCFTYHNIPPSCIEDITTEKMLNYLSTLQ